LFFSSYITPVQTKSNTSNSLKPFATRMGFSYWKTQVSYHHFAQKERVFTRAIKILHV